MGEYKVMPNNWFESNALQQAFLLRIRIFVSDMPNVISPAWKPWGHRQTIVPTVERTKIRQAAE